MSASRFDLKQAEIPLFFIRMRGGVAVTGLTVTVTVVNALDGSTLLAASPCAETSVGSGLYVKPWVHGLGVTTDCIATYSVTNLSGTKLYKEEIALENAVTSNLEMVGIVDDENDVVGELEIPIEVSGLLDSGNDIVGVLDVTNDLVANVDLSQNIVGSYDEEA